MQTQQSVFQDTTNVQVASVLAIDLPPSKRRKLGKQPESFEGGLVQSLSKVVQEVAVAREALSKIKEDLGQQSIILHAICEAIQIVL
jgi:flagellar hook-basal body complex protein FliE